MIVAFIIDRSVWVWAFEQYKIKYDFGEADWYRMLRVVGSAYFWLMIAIMFWIWDAKRFGIRDWFNLVARGATLMGAVILAAVLSELVKICVRRMRPDQTDGYTVLRDWTDRGFDAGGLCFPSSHTTIAFAGAWVLHKYYPMARGYIYTVAAGAAFTRVLSSAHFVSDALGGVFLGLVCGAMAWHIHQFNTRLFESYRANEPELVFRPRLASPA